MYLAYETFVKQVETLNRLFLSLSVIESDSYRVGIPI